MIQGARTSEAVGQRLIRCSSDILRSKAAASAFGVAGMRRGLSVLQGAASVAAPAAKALPSYVLNCPETQVTTLPNGLRVASEVCYPEQFPTHYSWPYRAYRFLYFSAWEDPSIFHNCTFAPLHTDVASGRKKSDNPFHQSYKTVS